MVGRSPGSIAAYLLAFMGELKAKGVDLYLHQQSLDTSTPSGKAMFQMLGVFSEFEREIIRERVVSGLARAKAQGRKLGRPRCDDPKRVANVRQASSQGLDWEVALPTWNWKFGSSANCVATGPVSQAAQSADNASACCKTFCTAASCKSGG